MVCEADVLVEMGCSILRSSEQPVDRSDILTDLPNLMRRNGLTATTDLELLLVLSVPEPRNSEQW